jgi:hypothetical protein
LVAVLLAVAASVIVVAFPDDDETVMEPWLAQLETLAADTDGIDIYQGASSPAVSLRRLEASWRVASLDGYPAQMAALRAMVQAMVEARKREPRSANRARYAELGVDDPTQRGSTGSLLVFLQGDQVLGQWVLGESSATGQVVRAREDTRSWLIDQVIPASTQAMDWVDSLLLNLPETSIQRIDFAAAEQGYQMTASASGWQVQPVPPGRTLRAQPFLAQPAQALEGLRFEAVQAAKPETEADVLASVTYDFDDGGRIVAQRLSEEGGRWVQFQVMPGSQGQRDWTAIAAVLRGWQFEFPVHRMATLFRPLEEQLTPLPSQSAEDAS